MTKTDAEWQALDQRIACEIMGLLTWDDLTPAERQDYIDVTPKKFLDMSLERWKKNYWKRQHESVFPLHAFSGWQPHLDVEQALRALDTVADKYPDVGYTLERATPKRLRSYMCAFGNPDAPETLTFAPTLREAICLAIEQFLDAQKEEQHAQED